MPELPEVETIARALREGGRDGPSLLGREVAGVLLLNERTLASPSPAEFMSRLPGQTVLDVGRRGKFVVIALDQAALLFHLRMSGDLRIEPGFDPQGQPLPPPPYTRLAITFLDGYRLVFTDARKFGRAWLAASAEEITAGLGPDPFDPTLTPDIFYEMMHSRSRQLKPLLLDQTFMAGLGNIYTDEALHLAHLHPNRISNRLSLQEVERLLESIHIVLSEGIRRNGASIDWVYRGGDFQNTFRAYQRTGQPCPVCGHPIERILVGQRGTHYCPICQQPEV